MVHLFFKISSYIITKSKFFLFLILSIASTHAMDVAETDSQIHTRLLGRIEPLSADPDVYVGAGFSQAKEPMYFAVEKVGKANYPIWQKFYDDTKQTVKLLAGFRTFCCRFSKPPHLEDTQQCTIFNCDDNDYQQGLMNKMSPQYDRLKKIFGTNGTESGLSGFKQQLNDTGSTHVCYFSKQPIRGKFKPNLLVETFSSLKVRQEAYKAIIICFVLDETPTFPFTVHRGIFKFPFQELENDYKKSSLHLHEWGGTFGKEVLNNKTHARIMPTAPMADILDGNIPPQYMNIDRAACTLEGSGIYDIDLTYLSTLYRGK
jgi:hypothetical protein